jgi:hypothetical protein
LARLSSSCTTMHVGPQWVKLFFIVGNGSWIHVVGVALLLVASDIGKSEVI